MAADITFGVEFEFAFPKAALPASNPRPKDDDEQHHLAVQYVAKWLEETSDIPVAITCLCEQMEGDLARICGEAPDEKHHIDEFTALRGPIGLNPATLTSADCYLVQSDSVIPPGRNGWCGLEIATAARSLTTIREDSSELAGFLKHMRNWQVSLAVTPLCGLHIHVGHKGEGITVDTAKRMVTLVALLEESLLIKLVTPERMTSKYFAPIMHFSVLTERLRATRAQAGNNLNDILPSGYGSGEFWNANGRSEGPFISEIWRCQRLQDVKDALMHSEVGSRCSLNLTLRYPGDSAEGIIQPDPRTCTFEFRYPQGSFCTDFVKMWVMITSCTLALCREGNDASYRRTMSSVFQVLDLAEREEQEQCIPGLLQALGLGGHVQNWGQLMGEINNGRDRSLTGNGEFRSLSRERNP